MAVPDAALNRGKTTNYKLLHDPLLAPESKIKDKVYRLGGVVELKQYRNLTMFVSFEG